MLEVIEWVEHNSNLLMWKFPDSDKEIKNGAQLTVRESQQAMLLNEGQMADIFGPGRHQLSTKNVPVLSTLKGWKYGFESPYKADVYFFSTRQFINLRWGTPAPIMMRDPQFQQVRVRAFGTYNIRIKDVARFFREYAGTYPAISVSELESQLRDFIAPKFGEVLSQAGISVMDVAGNVTELSARIEPMLAPYFEELGFELTRFMISSVTLPDEVSEFYDKMTSMNMVGDMNRFQQFNIANAIGQPGTEMAQGVQGGMMMGMAINAIQQSQAMQAGVQPQGSAAPAEDDVMGKLTKLKTLFENGLINQDEYDTKKKELLAQF